MRFLIVPAVVISCATVGLAQTQPSPPLQLGPPTPQGLIGYDGAGGAGAATQPAVDPDNIPRVEAGFTEFLSTRFRAHEPIYFIAGPVDPNSKFQVSLKYQLFGDSGDVARLVPPAPNFYVAYSQTSF